MRTVMTKYAGVVDIFKACRLFDPFRIGALGADIADFVFFIYCEGCGSRGSTQELLFISQAERAQISASTAARQRPYSFF